jgi:DNA polymerase
MEQVNLFNFGDLAGDTTPTLFRDLAELRAAAIACQKCPLAVGRNHVVVERGAPTARVMIVGEGPGQTEDETGLPFVGRAGQLLDKIIASVGWDSSRDVYICNVVKCRPPENRVPTDEESRSCRHFLLEQMRLVAPWIILLAGATAVRGVLGDKTGITKIRGQWRQWQGYWVMPIFHPSYLLRNASREQGGPKWLMWQDIQAVKAKYEELRTGTMS